MKLLHVLVIRIKLLSGRMRYNLPNDIMVDETNCSITNHASPANYLYRVAEKPTFAGSIFDDASSLVIAIILQLHNAVKLFL